jgi:UDP-glucose 4-epimerase
MSQRAMRRVGVVGGAGFIGGHFVDRLLASDRCEELTVYDNFSSGREWHLAPHRSDARLKVVRGDVRDLEQLVAAIDGHDTVIHLASNPILRGR